VPIGPPNLASTVSRFSFPISRTRYGPTTTDLATGLPVRGAAVTTTILAHVWDAPADVIALLPEGGERGRVVEGHTVDVLGVLGDDNDTVQAADLLGYDGDTFRVIQVTRRSTGPTGAITIWRFLAEAVNRP
jgi:hypothetical protein